MNAANTVENIEISPKRPPEYTPNAATLVAAREARNIMSGKIRVEWNHPPATKEELKAKLKEIGQEA
jgi:hypothetical protein